MAQDSAQSADEQAQNDALEAKDDAGAEAEEAQSESEAESQDAEQVAQAEVTDAVFENLPDTLIAPADGPALSLTPDFFWGYEANDYYLGATQAMFDVGGAGALMAPLEPYTGLPPDFTPPGLGLNVVAYGAEGHGGLNMPWGKVGDAQGPITMADTSGADQIIGGSSGGAILGNGSGFTFRDPLRVGDSLQPMVSLDYQRPMHMTGIADGLLDVSNTPSATGIGGYSQSPIPTTVSATELASTGAPSKNQFSTLADAAAAPQKLGAAAPEAPTPPEEPAWKNNGQPPSDTAAASTDAASSIATGGVTLVISVFMEEPDPNKEPAAGRNRAAGEPAEATNTPQTELAAPETTASNGTANDKAHVAWRTTMPPLVTPSDLLLEGNTDKALSTPRLPGSAPDDAGFPTREKGSYQRLGGVSVVDYVFTADELAVARHKYVAARAKAMAAMVDLGPEVTAEQRQAVYDSIVTPMLVAANHQVTGSKPEDFAEETGWGAPALQQGVANIANGAQDSVIGLANLGIRSGVAPTIVAVFVEIPQIQSPDWAKDKYVFEDPTLHKVGKVVGGESLVFLVTMGTTTLASTAKGLLTSEVIVAEESPTVLRIIRANLDNPLGGRLKGDALAMPGATSDIMVIGELGDTAGFGATKGYQVLKVADNAWSVHVNEGWVMRGIIEGRTFLLVSKPGFSTLRTVVTSESGAVAREVTVFFRELKMLRDAGYVRVGNTMFSGW